ncbi:hypothetical protein WICMUC_001546 [Wickerhamomyces mucosus]|uniref:DUF1746 domain-containing protein n=1 Tax=Wickerhamomyces mucosus TaxID=1378264 RepID=A0A9P8TH27_9ASCO|nr:hypothetical protein WICMUC_001546 [Wickerhamomyces mucosus]
MVISSHILKQELPIANDDGFIYGHHTLQIIGEQQLNNKISLIGYDLILFYLQLIVYAIQYSSKREKSTSKAEFLNINDDGYQGETLAIRIPLINVINIPLVSIEELKSEQELNDESNGTRFNSQIDTLLNGDTIPYGSIDNNL